MRQDPARVTGKIDEQVELLRREANFIAVPDDAALVEVDDEVAALELPHDFAVR